MLLHSMYDYSMLDIPASIPIWFYYIPFLLFAILLPCIWHLSFVHAGFSLCNALCHSSFYHYLYSVLPLLLLRHAIIASSMLTAIIYGHTKKRLGAPGNIIKRPGAYFMHVRYICLTFYVLNVFQSHVGTLVHLISLFQTFSALKKRSPIHSTSLEKSEVSSAAYSTPLAK